MHGKITQGYISLNYYIFGIPSKGIAKRAHSCPITLNNSYNGVPGTGMVQSLDRLGRAGAAASNTEYCGPISQSIIYREIGAAPAARHQKGEQFFPIWRPGAGAAPLVTKLPCIRYCQPLLKDWPRPYCRNSEA